MKYDRKSFLKRTGLLTSGLFASSMFGSLPMLSSCTSQKNETLPFGLQLWTLRDDLPKDPRGVIEKVAGFGYHYLESFEGPDGIFWGMGNKGFKQLMDDLGMRLVAAHCDVFDGLERKAQEAAEIGVEYLVCPWIGPQESLDAYKEMAERFNQVGETCKAAGLKFAYHNHDYTFEKMDGEYPQDILMNETDADLVEHEMDIYWVVVAGEDPAEWIRRYPGRFTLSHVKDRFEIVPDGEHNVSTVLGTGTIDFPPLLTLAKADGMKYFFVEQEQYDGTTPLESVELNAKYMKQLRLGS